MILGTACRNKKCVLTVTHLGVSTTYTAMRHVYSLDLETIYIIVVTMNIAEFFLLIKIIIQ